MMLRSGKSKIFPNKKTQSNPQLQPIPEEETCGHDCEVWQGNCCICSDTQYNTVYYTFNNSCLDIYSVVDSSHSYCSTCKQRNPKPLKINFSTVKIETLTNSVVLNAEEQKLAEALATIKQKDIEIADLKSKLDKTDNVIKGYFS